MKHRCGIMRKFPFCLIIVLFLFSATSSAQKEPLDSNILVVVNDKPAGTIREIKKDINSLFPAAQIEKVNILKDTLSLKKYGQTGKYGAIEIYLKQATYMHPKTNDEAVATESPVKETDTPPAFKGGQAAWIKFLEQSLNFTIPYNNYAPPGTYKVVVQFEVSKDGIIGNLKPLTNFGFGMEQEIVRLLSKRPQWNPAIRNGQPVAAIHEQAVNFVVFYDFELSAYSVPAGKPVKIEVRFENKPLDPKEFEITLSAGSIIHDSVNKYIVTVDKPGIVLLTLLRKGKEEIGKVAITVK